MAGNNYPRSFSNPLQLEYAKDLAGIYKSEKEKRKESLEKFKERIGEFFVNTRDEIRTSIEDTISSSNKRTTRTSIECYIIYIFEV